MVRIITGKHRGRRLHSPAGTEVRPTSDRTRTALFNILGPWIEAKRVLDLYAGIGGIGCECLSRGASHVTFVEKNRDAIRCLKENLEMLRETANAILIPDDVERAISRLGGRHAPYDLVYADPPYRQEDAPRILALLRAAALTHPESIVIIEHALNPFPEGECVPGWLCYRNSRYGKAMLSFFTQSQASEKAT